MKKLTKKQRAERKSPSSKPKRKTSSDFKVGDSVYYEGCPDGAGYGMVTELPSAEWVGVRTPPHKHVTMRRPWLLTRRSAVSTTRPAPLYKVGDRLATKSSADLFVVAAVEWRGKKRGGGLASWWYHDTVGMYPKAMRENVLAPAPRFKVGDRLAAKGQSAPFVVGFMRWDNGWLYRSAESHVAVPETNLDLYREAVAAEPKKPEPPDSAKDIAEVCDALKALLLKKNASYGDAALTPMNVFSRATAVESIKCRIDDKLARLARGHGLPDESLDDTIDDLLGYLVLLKIAKKRAPAVSSWMQSALMAALLGGAGLAYVAAKAAAMAPVGMKAKANAAAREDGYEPAAKEG